MKIDVVITWVDGNDPLWIKERDKFTTNKGEKNLIRFRDMGLLKYWFRGIEQYAPWVNNIYFVTWGHYPKWLNINNNKLKIINHKDYIPAKYLPTFSSHTIELNLNRIDGLSEYFIYFNDDMFLTNYTKKEDFFLNELPVDAAIMNAISPTESLINNVIINDLKIINKNFNKKDTLKKLSNWYSIKYGYNLIRNLLFKYWYGFLGFQNYHGPTPLLKTTLNEVWEKEKKTLDRTCLNKFRKYEDVNQWIFEYWQFASNKFHAGSYKRTKYYDLNDNIDDIVHAIKQNKFKSICINDADVCDNYEKIQIKLVEAFESILPIKSSFEI